MKTTGKKLMARWAMDEVDAVRMVLECLEKMGAGEEESRGELMRKVRRVVDEGVRAVQEAERTESFGVVAWASVEARAGRRPTTRRDLRSFVRRMLRVEGAAELPLRRMRVEDCRRILDTAFGSSPSSYKKGRAILHSIFVYGRRHAWCGANPVESIEAPEVREQPIAPLTIGEVRRLEAAAELPEHRAMRLSLRLMLYCGLRPHEVQRLKPEDIDREAGEVIIRPAVSKTGGGRVVPLRCAAPQGGKIPGNWAVRWRRLRHAAGFQQWRADVCRHSFASYHAAHYRNMSTLQCEMGHGSLRLLRTRYVSPVSARTAANYWQKRADGDGGGRAGRTLRARGGVPLCADSRHDRRSGDEGRS